MTQGLAPSVQAACRRWASRPALTHHGHTWSYAQLWERIVALAEAYRSLGVAPGDRVVCQLPTCPEHLVAANAAWLCGAVHVGAHKDLTSGELASLVERTQATAVVFQPPPGLDDPLAPLRTVRTRHPSILPVLHGHPPEADEHALSELLARPTTDAPIRDTALSGPEDTDLLLLTSGTTGTSKAVEESLPALWAKMTFFADTLGPTPDDVHLLYLPLCHAFGLKLALMALASGGHVVLLDRFSSAEALRLVGEEKVTVLPATPTHLRLLLEELDPRRHSTDSLRWIVSAAAPLVADLVEQVYDGFGADVYSVYGCTEGFLTATADRDEIRRGSVGTAVFEGPKGTAPDGSVAVRDPEEGKFLPPGGVGEIVYGAARPVRYWDQPPAATDGWYRTGDVGWLDHAGRLTVSGRLKELVNRGGLKVSPVEIEAHLAAHPALADYAVIPAPDPVLGEAICACVVPATSQTPTLAELRADLAEHLSRHKLPDELCVVDAIPRSRVGKIDRDALVRHVMEQGLARQRLERSRSVTTVNDGSK